MVVVVVVDVAVVAVVVVVVVVLVTKIFLMVLLQFFKDSICVVQIQLLKTSKENKNESELCSHVKYYLEARAEGDFETEVF